MLNAAAVWNSIDALAARHHLSVSNLARKAGLDSSALAPARRQNEDGSYRRPSLGTIENILTVTGTSFTEFAGLVTGEPVMQKSLPSIPLSQAGDPTHYERNALVGEHPLVDAVGVEWKDAYVVVFDNDDYVPFYLMDQKLIVAPREPRRRGDTLYMVTRDGNVAIGYLIQENLNTVSFYEKPSHETKTLEKDNLRVLARAPALLEG